MSNYHDVHAACEAECARLAASNHRLHQALERESHRADVAEAHCKLLAANCATAQKRRDNFDIGFQEAYKAAKRYRAERTIAVCCAVIMGFCCLVLSVLLEGNLF